MIYWCDLKKETEKEGMYEGEEHKIWTKQNEQRKKK